MSNVIQRSVLRTKNSVEELTRWRVNEFWPGCLWGKTVERTVNARLRRLWIAIWMVGALHFIEADIQGMARIAAAAAKTHSKIAEPVLYARRMAILPNLHPSEGYSR